VGYRFTRKFYLHSLGQVALQQALCRLFNKRVVTILCIGLLKQRLSTFIFRQRLHIRFYTREVLVEIHKESLTDNNVRTTVGNDPF